MAYTAAKDLCSQAELNRFACAFLNCKDIHQSIDWDAAAKQFDPTVKTASFKTVTQRAMKKIFAAVEDGGAGEGKVAAAAKGKDGGRKRKATAAGEDGDDGGEMPAAKKGKGERTGKKAKEVEEDEDAGAEGDGEAEVKGEDDEDEI